MHLHVALQLALATPFLCSSLALLLASALSVSLAIALVTIASTLPRLLSCASRIPSLSVTRASICLCMTPLLANRRLIHPTQLARSRALPVAPASPFLALCPIASVFAVRCRTRRSCYHTSCGEPQCTCTPAASTRMRGCSSAVRRPHEQRRRHWHIPYAQSKHQLR